jgi:hypothetical protein
MTVTVSNGKDSGTMSPTILETAEARRRNAQEMDLRELVLALQARVAKLEAARGA